MTTPNRVEDVLKRLAVQQDLVASRIGMLTEPGWDAEPTEEALEQLVGTGHFTANSHQLDWTPREIVGHLRDSNWAFVEVIELLRSDDRPKLEDVEHPDAGTLEDYRDEDPDRLVEQHDQSQNDLRSIMKDLREDELDNVAIDTDGAEITLLEFLGSLPGHVEAHANHLSAITAEAL